MFTPSAGARQELLSVAHNRATPLEVRVQPVAPADLSEWNSMQLELELTYKVGDAAFREVVPLRLRGGVFRRHASSMRAVVRTAVAASSPAAFAVEASVVEALGSPETFAGGFFEDVSGSTAGTTQDLPAFVRSVRVVAERGTGQVEFFDVAGTELISVDNSSDEPREYPVPPHAWTWRFDNANASPQAVVAEYLV